MSVKNLKQKKTELRSKYKKLRKNLSADLKNELDRKIFERLTALPEYKSADSIFAFISKDIEVDTEAVINDALNSGKKVAVPLCDVDTTTIEFYYINSYEDLKDGFYGLLEPDIEVCEKAESSDLMIVPGLVFDRNGYRLGFGKGYYDRYISDYKGLTVGVCYSRCIENELPLGYYDKPINLVVTDKFTIDTR